MSWKRALIAIALLAPVIALLAFGMTRDPRQIDSPLPGRPAPEFTLAQMPMQATDEAGDTVELASLRGDVVVLNFFASWCLACRGEHPTLARVAREYEGRPVHFFGVVYNDSPANARRWIEEMGGQSYPALLDPGARTAIDYGLYGVPETFIIGPTGTVDHKFTGPVDAPALRAEIDRLLPERSS